MKKNIRLLVFFWILALQPVFGQIVTPASPEIITEDKLKRFEFGLYLAPTVSFTKVENLQQNIYPVAKSMSSRMVGNYGIWIAYNVDKRLSIRTGLRRIRRYVGIQFEGIYGVEYEDPRTQLQGPTFYYKPDPTAEFLLKHWQIPIIVKYNFLLKKDYAGYMQVGFMYESGGKEVAFDEFDNPLALSFYYAQKLPYAFSSKTNTAHVGIGYEKKIFGTQKLRIGLGYYHGLGSLIDDKQNNIISTFPTTVMFKNAYNIQANNLALELEIGF